MRLENLTQPAADRARIETAIDSGEYTEPQKHYMRKELAAIPADYLARMQFRKGVEFILRELLKGFKE